MGSTGVIDWKYGCEQESKQEHPKLTAINAKLRERQEAQGAHEREVKADSVKKASTYLEDFYKVGHKRLQVAGYLLHRRFQEPRLLSEQKALKSLMEGEFVAVGEGESVAVGDVPPTHAKWEEGSDPHLLLVGTI